jgi:membrane protein
MENTSKNREFLSLSFYRTLWDKNPNDYSGLQRIFVKWIQFLSRILRDFLDDRCLLRASALSFNTILSLVPLFALAFAVLKGLGVHTALESFVIRRLTAGSQEIAGRIIAYIDNTKMGSLGAVGLAALIITVIALLGNIEEAFNDIWGVRETRSIGRKFSDYLSVVVSAPILLLAATSITTSLQNQNLVSWLVDTQYIGDLVLFSFKLVPYLSIWVALVFLYFFIPNTKVRISSALLGGMIAGVIWQIAQWGFIHFQVGVAKYNAIYGTLSALPIFMVWIYTSWIIVLFGVEIVSAHQNRKTFLHDTHHPNLNYASREMTALVLLLAAADAYYDDATPWTCERLAGETGVPARIVNEILTQLVDLKYFVATGGENPAFIPARAPEHMYVGRIMEDMKNYGEPGEFHGMEEIRKLLMYVQQGLETCDDEGKDGVTIRDLVMRLREKKATTY